MKELVCIVVSMGMFGYMGMRVDVYENERVIWVVACGHACASSVAAYMSRMGRESTCVVNIIWAPPTHIAIWI